MMMLCLGETEREPLLFSERPAVAINKETRASGTNSG
jgi:hypothetical protein